MKILTTPAEFRFWRRSLPPSERVGLVPTMGALHAGHLSLIEACRRQCSRVAVSIFVNPIQFNSAADLDKYPRPFEADRQLCEAAGVDAIFHPDPVVMYPEGFATSCEVAGLDRHLCGATRPGHFQGVCTVVLKLFHIVEPHTAYFGEKDFQQAAIIGRMVRDLDLPLEVKVLPTLREPSGLAMSSRNERLSQGARERATAIYQGLSAAQAACAGGERSAVKLIETARKLILASGPESIDYLEVADRDTIAPVAEISRPAVMATAVFYDGVRLIDNIGITP